MTALPDWMISTGDGLTAADHEALPEEVCRQIEIVDGAIFVNPSPRRAHQHLAHNLVTALKSAAGPEGTAVGNVDLRLRDTSWTPMTRTYALVGLDTGRLDVKEPVRLNVDLDELR